jgi:zinc transport system substrate-binding protein
MKKVKFPGIIGMKKWSLIGLGACLLVAAQTAAAERFLVAVSIAPLADFARQVGGEHVQVFTLIPPGASPHTYELKPSQVQRVAKARLLILNGAGLEYWADKLVEGTDDPELRTVDTSKGISLISGGEYGGNPHVWLDVRQAIVQVQHIRDALVMVDPDHEAAYHERTARYLDQLESLDREISEEIKGWSQHQFIAFHPAWVYFARRYGLKQAAVIEKSPGREPSPAEIVKIIKMVKQIKARAIFAEPQFSKKAARAIASETGTRVLFLDPLGASFEDSSYLTLMRRNLAQMASALK